MRTATGDLRVLLLEDDEEDAMLAREALTGGIAGRFTVRHAATLRDALLALADAPDVVLTDLNLPDSSGFATVQRLRAASAAPIVVFTGIEDDELAMEAFRAGAQDYLVKGQYDASLVARSIRYAVERRRTELEAMEARRREEELRQRARLDAMKTTFINTAAHELQTPMTPLLVSLHLLQDARTEPRVRHDALEKAARNAQRLEGVIEAILKVSRVQAGMVRLERSRVRLEDVARRAVEHWRGRADAAGLTLAVDGPGAEVVGDTERLDELFGHLLYNAIRFTPRGGSVAVQVRTVGAAAVAEVEDDGPGIPAADVERIFEPFVQLEAARTQTEAGFGLGLFFARAVAEQHGGTLKAGTGQSGRGARLTISLPRADGPTGLSTAPAVAGEHEGHRLQRP
ncbi:MAG: ATP-binding protein [Thermoplasmatota archaeon]